jgi:hypothetical protein
MKAGWRLARLIRKSVSKSRGIFYYPLISGIVSVAVFAVSFISLFITISFNFSSATVAIYAGGFVLAYIITGFLSTLILLSMLMAYRAYNSGTPISLREAFGKAWSYRKQAMEWALFYTLLVMILRIIESRFRGIGQIVVGAIGSMMIAIATFFAIPSILDNRSGPIRAVKESVATITKNFGQTFGGVAYVDLYTLIFTLSGLLLLFGGIFLIPVTLLLIPVVIIVAGVLFMILGVVLNYTYMNVLKLVLFDYLNGKGLPEGFSEDDIRSAIKRKRPRSMFGVIPSDDQGNF